MPIAFTKLLLLLLTVSPATPPPVNDETILKSPTTSAVIPNPRRLLQLLLCFQGVPTTRSKEANSKTLEAT